MELQHFLIYATKHTFDTFPFSCTLLKTPLTKYALSYLPYYIHPSNLAFIIYPTTNKHGFGISALSHRLLLLHLLHGISWVNQRVGQELDCPLKIIPENILRGWFGLVWVDLGWVGLGWVGLGWVGLGWVGLGWVGLGWVGAGLVGMGWVRQRRVGIERDGIV